LCILAPYALKRLPQMLREISQAREELASAGQQANGPIGQMPDHCDN